ncbi:MAG: hypothetical protein ACOH2I_09175 [Pseudomonas sp.]
MGYRLALALSLTLFAHPGTAAPAAWYQWRSVADGLLFCTQAQPGPGWERFAGPFDNASCKTRPRRSLL